MDCGLAGKCPRPGMTLRVISNPKINELAMRRSGF
jgi:hypothetical protein